MADAKANSVAEDMRTRVRWIEVVVNPTSGSALGQELAEKHVEPLLRSAGCRVRVRTTQSATDGVRIGGEIARDWLCCNDERALDIVSIGGDGTTHELLNGLYLSGFCSDQGAIALDVRLALVPAGTANALFSALYPHDWTQDVQEQVASVRRVGELATCVIGTMLNSVGSLASALDKHETGKLSPLPLMLNSLDVGTQKRLISHLVTSHALHAAILHDADTREMRDKYVGIDRFKAAAQINATRWTHGTLTLEGPVGRYSPETAAFEPVSQEPSVVINGPFLYLNAMVTDRLESSFVPAPLSCAAQLPRDAIDLVVIRPRRDASLPQDDVQAAREFATTRLAEITSAMYSAGSHIHMTYSNANATEPVVEYLRCSRYTFTPQHAGKDWLVCTDGLISHAKSTTVSRWPDTPHQTAHADRVGRHLAPPMVWR